MKKVLTAFVLMIMMLSLASCKSEGYKVDPSAVTQDSESNRQNEIIASLGVSIENKWIVGYRAADEYLEYVVVEYEENGNKKAEASHRFYSNESYYQKALRKHGNAVADSDDEGWYIKIASNNADTGSYKADFEKLDKDFTLKTTGGTQ